MDYLAATEIATYRLNWPRGRFSENGKCNLKNINLKFSLTQYFEDFFFFQNSKIYYNLVPFFLQS